MADSEWEESLMVVELHGILESDWMSGIGDECKIVGLDSSAPMLQLDRYTFQGEHKDCAGTMVMFEIQPGEQEEELRSPKYQGDEIRNHKYNYSCHTHKIVHMRRAFLTERQHPREAPDAMEEAPKPSGPLMVDLCQDDSMDSAEESEKETENRNVDNDMGIDSRGETT